MDILNSTMLARYHFLVHCTRRYKRFLIASHLPILTAISLAVVFIQSYNRSRGTNTGYFTPFMDMTKIASELPSIKPGTISESFRHVRHLTGIILTVCALWEIKSILLLALFYIKRLYHSYCLFMKSPYIFVKLIIRCESKRKKNQW